MDTDETIEPAGGQDVSSSQDTSMDIAQPTESEEVVDGNESDEVGEAPTLLAGKYKSAEELEKAYSELEGKLGEQGRKAELANLLEKQTGMNAEQIRDYLTQQQTLQYQQQVQENPGMAAFQEVQSLKQQLALQAEQKELDSFLSSDEGKPYQDFKDKILNLGLNLERGKAYSDIAREYFGQAIARGQESAYKKIDTKRMTQSSGVKSAPSSKPSLDDLRGLTSAEMEAVLSSR